MKINKKYWIIFLILLALFSIVFAINSGKYDVSFNDWIMVFTGNFVSTPIKTIILEFRLPRIILASIVGVSLAVSGYILQTVTHNNIADSGILGINSGAMLFVTLYYFMVSNNHSLPLYLENITTMGFAFIGAILAICLNFFLSLKKVGISMARFILNGIGISIGLSSLTTYFSLKINPDDYAQINNSLEGSMKQANWDIINNILPWFVVAVILVFVFRKKLIMLSFSDIQLRSIGFPVEKWRIIFIVISSILVCVSVISAGGISFIGIIIPYTTSIFINKNSRLFIPTLIIFGICFLLISDTLVKTIFSPNELPLNSLVGIIGIPYLLSIVVTGYKNRR